MPGPLLARKVRLQAQVQPDTVPRPTVTACEPSAGANGASVAVRGTGFWYPDSHLHQYHAFAVHFGNDTGANATAVAVANATAVTCTVPNGTPGTTVPIRVFSPGGDGVGERLFTYSQATGVSPNPAVVGSTVTVTGVGLGGATTFAIDGNVGNVSSANANAVTFTLPLSTPDGPHTLVVGVPGGNVQVGGTSSFLVNQVGTTPVSASVGDISTSTGVWTTVTTLNVTTVHGGPLSIIFGWSGFKRATTGNVYFRIKVDGSVVGSGAFQSSVGAGSAPWSAGMIYLASVALGTHSVTVEWKDDAGDEAILAASTPDNDYGELLVREGAP